MDAFGLLLGFVARLEGDPPMSAAAGWNEANASGTRTHVCHCIGCCRLCGTCRTWPGHTPDYCKLLQRQKAEREALQADRETERS